MIISLVLGQSYDRPSDLTREDFKIFVIRFANYFHSRLRHLWNYFGNRRHLWNTFGNRNQNSLVTVSHRLFFLNTITFSNKFEVLRRRHTKRSRSTERVQLIVAYIKSLQIWVSLFVVMARCLTTPSHSLNQCWSVNNGFLWRLSASSFTGNNDDISL